MTSETLPLMSRPMASARAESGPSWRISRVIRIV